ncbi:MAG: exopolysaccharide biosynthesis polyprenyl glycosylphosphotransferase [Candidatus Omnitrophica bacterium]|nr:exopolysaccharide biosynthesis polyprenyl glycosylphosphotransferase [Candidatus Omnitrophota bacterium]
MDEKSTQTPRRFGDDPYWLPLLLLAFSDALVFAGSMWLAYVVRFYSPLEGLFPLQAGWDPPSFSLFFKFGLAAAIIGVAVFERLGFYRARIGMDRRVHILRIIFGVIVVNLILQAFLSLTATPLSRGTRIVAFCLTIPLAVLAHYFLKNAHHSMLRRGWGYRRTLLIAANRESVPHILQEIGGGHGSEFLIAGVQLSDLEASADFEGESVGEIPILGNPILDLRRTIARGDIDTVFIGLEADQIDWVPQIIEHCEAFQVDYFLTSDLFEKPLDKVQVDGKVLAPVLSLGDTPLSGSGVVLKRLMDLAGSAALILVCLPVWALVAVLIKLDSKGPLFYKQERIGHDGRTFEVIKFRTMRPDAEVESGPVWSTQDDPRRTRLGKFLRETNLDETPQFINVFRGEMSLVGPRPERPYFVNQFKKEIPSYMKRHMVKSGITGWAQVNGLRGDTSIEERTVYDMWYIEHWSVWLDLRILFRTLKATENAH